MRDYSEKGLVPEIEKRRSRRMIQGGSLTDDTVERIMSAAAYAPSCLNRQPWRFIVVRKDDVLKKIHETLPPANAWVKAAPCVVFAATKYELDERLDGGRDYALFDTGMAVMNLQLQAVREGLRAHTIAGYNASAAAKILGVPDGYILIAAVVLGRPGTDDGVLNPRQRAEETSARSRKSAAEVIAEDAWNFLA
ncbi:MAG: nitroreductase family protein [Spirochaetales bacterium]|jgi:nitroreductase|nr:nitroreductase family protein [Spirochaetales bacterium]